MLPGPPELGAPASWQHVVWVDAPNDEAVNWYDELDAECWSIRCVRRFRDGSLTAASFASPNWREEMPDQAVPPVAQVNANPDFVAREISRVEFEVMWTAAMDN